MTPAQAALAGAASGALAALPIALLLRRASERRAPSVAVGLVASLAGLVALEAATLAAWRADPASTVPYGAAAALAFVAVALASGLRAWRRMGQ